MSKDNLFDAPIDRQLLVEHARCVLNSHLQGVKIAEEMEMTKSQVYAYRQGRRKIENAYVDTLLKFEKVYQKHLK